MLLHNTKTLPPSMVIPRAVKRFAKSIQFINPKLAMRFADKLFRTPVAFQIPEREKMMWKSAQKKRIKINSLNIEIDVLSYGYSTKKVLLVHGWSGRSTQLFMVADKLLEKGYMVISFDAPAHGKSEGKQTSLPEFLEVIKQLNTDFGPFESAVGHSLGGMALYNSAHFLQLKSFVTIGAGNKISTIIKRFNENLGLKPKTGVLLKEYYNTIFNKDVDSLASYQHCNAIKIPVLVIHDTQDGDVSVSCAKNIRQNLEKGSLLLTQGLGHTKILRDKYTMNRVVDFIKSNP